LPDHENPNQAYECQPNTWHCQKEHLGKSVLQAMAEYKKNWGRGPPKGRFLYFPKLFPVRWLFWKVEALPALGDISDVGRQNLRILDRDL